MFGVGSKLPENIRYLLFVDVAGIILVRSAALATLLNASFTMAQSLTSC